MLVLTRKVEEGQDVIEIGPTQPGEIIRVQLVRVNALAQKVGLGIECHPDTPVWRGELGVKFRDYTPAQRKQRR